MTKITIADDRVDLGTADSGFVDVIDFNGENTGAIPIGAESRPPTRQEFEAEADRLAHSVRVAPGGDTALRNMLLRIPMPERTPAYSDLVASPDGTLWVTVSLPADTLTRVNVVDRSGHPIGNATFPKGARILDVDATSLLVRYPDAEGVSLVALYRIRAMVGRAAHR